MIYQSMFYFLAEMRFYRIVRRIFPQMCFAAVRHWCQTSLEQTQYHNEQNELLTPINLEFNCVIRLASWNHWTDTREFELRMVYWILFHMLHIQMICFGSFSRRTSPETAARTSTWPGRRESTRGSRRYSWWPEKHTWRIMSHMILLHKHAFMLAFFYEKQFSKSLDLLTLKLTRVWKPISPTKEETIIL